MCTLSSYRTLYSSSLFQQRSFLWSALCSTVARHSNINSSNSTMKCHGKETEHWLVTSSLQSVIGTCALTAHLWAADCHSQALGHWLLTGHFSTAKYHSQTLVHSHQRTLTGHLLHSVLEQAASPQLVGATPQTYMMSLQLRPSSGSASSAGPMAHTRISSHGNSGEAWEPNLETHKEKLGQDSTIRMSVDYSVYHYQIISALL